MSFKAFSRDPGYNILLPTKSKRSQSALEYMMTYGWAILIIVIVAVILYSMGLFNPSSSITFTSSGFSPFTVSSSLCNNLGYKIAVLAGPIPNNANSLTISKVYLTSATGANATTASYTLKNPVTLKSGQSATILIPNVACNAANVHYSISANIEYSYTASTLGLQTVNTTGTVAGTSISGKPSVLTSYEPVTITNSQSSATPNPFQQMVVFNSTDPGFSSIATGNFGQNVEFFYYNGTVVPSWLENYTSDNATWWLKIAAIPAGSSETIYVGFAPTTTNLFNTVNDGEAPQIPCGLTPTSSCSNYAEYDDGATVFPEFYNNFAGTALNGFSGGTYTIDNGITIKDDGSMTSTSQIPDSNTAITIFGLFDSAGATPTDDGYALGYDFTDGGGGTGLIYNINSNSNIVYCLNFDKNETYGASNLIVNKTGYYSLYSIYKTDNLTTDFYFNNGFECGGSWLNGNPYYSLFSPTSSFQFYTQITSTAYEYWQYIFARSLPPNTIMPSITFGNIA